MEKSYGNDIPSFQRFLNDFCNTVIAETEEDDILPIRILNDHLIPEEIQGECLDWTLRYLAVHNCPPTLASLLSREVYEEIVKIDYLEFSSRTSESSPRKTEDHEVASNGDIDDRDHVKGVRADTVLNTSVLCSHVMDIIHETCQKWNNQLPEIQLPQMCHVTSFHEIKNTRRKMEDRHVILPDFNTLFDITNLPNQAYYAVFDGHAGTEAAVFASNHLHVHLSTCEKFSSDPSSALKCSYSATDGDFIKKAQKGKLKSGSTGVSALIRDNKLYVAWLGDSQALLVRNGQAVKVMEPHKPEREDEKARIEALGGCVVFMGTWRVNGNLAVSRAIGDIAQKTYICSDADVTTIDLDGTEDYLILACDGMWDTLLPDSVPKIVYDHLQETKGDKSSVAKTLVNYARDNGSSDNITVIVVFLRDEISAPQIKPLFDFVQTPTSQGDNVDSSKDDHSGTDNSKPSDSKGDNSSSSDVNQGRDNSNMDTSPSDSIKQVNDKIEDSIVGDANDDEPVLTPLDSTSNKSPSSRHSLDQSDSAVSTNRDYFPPNHVLKKEPVFIVGDTKPITPTKEPDTNSKKSVIPSSSEAQAIQPSYIYLPNQTSTISEFHRQLGVESQSDYMENSLPPLKTNVQPVHSVTDYFINSDAPYHGKKLKAKKTRKASKEGNKATSFSNPRNVKKKVDSKDPVIWAFTGKNTAPVQNYKLNQAAKSSSRNVLAPLTHTSINQSISTPAAQEIRYLDKFTKTKNFSDQDGKVSDSVNMPHTVFKYPLSVFTNSSITSNTISTSSQRTTSTTKHKGTMKKMPEFHQSWRPKRSSKIHSTGFSELPPTPLSNTKIHPTNDTL